MTTTLLASLIIVACRQGDTDSATASLEAAQTADASQDADGIRALVAGSTPEEAAQNILEQTIPDEVARFFPANLKIYWEGKAKVAKDCADIITKRAHKSMGDGARDQNACWEFINIDDDKQLAIHMVKDSVANVHQTLPEAIFAAFYEGVISELDDSAKVSELSVKQFLENDDPNLVQTVATIQSILDNRRPLVITALQELEASKPGTLATYASPHAFGGDANAEKLADNENVVNFLWSELSAAYYGSPDENEAFEKALPKTFAIFDKVAGHMGQTWWEY